jgi:two-component system LytT family sensor kinase
MNRLEKFIDHLFTHKRWAVHVLFWMLILFLYVVFFGRKNSNYIQTFFFVGLLMPVTVGATYFLNYYLVPRFLMKERYAFFLLYFIYTLIAAIFLEMVVAMLTFIVMAEIQIKNMSPASFDVFFLLVSLLMVVFLGVSIKLLLHWRQSKEDYHKLMRDKTDTELKVLKAQLNPHFLFNTLNNLYYLALEKSDKTPKAILQLSDMLDYVMRTSKSVRVPLEDELKQVDNYIGLELLRSEDRVSVETVISGKVEECTIGPMILITLIENAFKHGIMKMAGMSWIKLSVDSSAERMIISVSNSWKAKAPGNGIGLENLRRQLNLLYGEEFQLFIESNRPDEFAVNLTILDAR